MAELNHHDAELGQDPNSSSGGGGDTQPLLNDSTHSTKDQYKNQVKARDEIVSKLVNLLNAYGLELPTSIPELETALESVAELGQKAGDPTANRLSDGARQAALEAAGEQFSLLRQGSDMWKTMDFEEAFKKLQAELPTRNQTDVTFKNLTYEVTRAANTTDEPTVGDILVKVGGCLTCFPLLQRIWTGPKHKAHRAVVRDCSGIFKAGQVSLIIGPPGCGKSSLLKLLAGLVRPDRSHRIKGEVLYKGEPAKQGPHARFSLPKVAAYVQQVDRHDPLMTVEETLTFAFDSMEGGKHAAWLPDEEKTPEQRELLQWMDSRHSKVQMIMKTLGLSNVKTTIVGDVFTRGVSGGERRRVTTGEMLAGSQDVFLLDSISNGLDSSTTYDITLTLKRAAQTFGRTIIVALLQPAPEVYNLFDKVVVMATGGRIVYQGQREGVLPYFRSIGYECPARKDEADFVVEVTTDQGAMYAVAGGIEEGRRRTPRTPIEFEQCWRESEGYKKVQDELAQPVPGAGEPWPPNQQKLHAGTWWWHFEICFRKHWTLFKRDIAYIRTQMLTALLMALIVGSIFFQLPTTNVNSKFGVLFFSLLFLGLSGMNQLPAAVQSRAIFYKQHAQGFYPASANVVAEVAVQSLLTVGTTLVFAPILYFMVGLDTDAGRFFIFLAVLVVVNLDLAAYFRSLAAIMPNFQVAQSLAGLTLVFIVLFAGFLVNESIIPGVWIWIFWLNPLAWAFRAVVLNEFLAPKYTQACSVPLNPDGSCDISLSDAVLDAYAFRKDTFYIWFGIVFILILWVFSIVSTGILLHTVRWDASDNAPITQDEMEVAFPEGDSGSSSSVSDAESSDKTLSVAAGSPPQAEAMQSETRGAVADMRSGSSAAVAGAPVTGGTGGGAGAAMGVLAAPLPVRTMDAVGGVLGHSSGHGKERPAQRRPSRYTSNAAATRQHCEEDVTRLRMARQSSDGGVAADNFLRVIMAFRDLHYSVPHPSGDGMLELLKGVSGYAKPGELTALMGSSGAGKTTLLDVLAGRKTGGETTGNITINGHPKEAKSFARIAGYVEQVDTHSPVVTVREAVEFSATLRLEEKDWPPPKRQEFVEGILEILELKSIENRLIGSEDLGGLANEQRKRVTIAVELASNPSLLFLDEPTTGLDARSAQVVMRAIRKVAMTGRAVICTIHQPSTYLFEMFDSLLLLKKGGETVYFGELGTHSSSMIRYLSTIPGTKPIADNANPATWMLEQIGAGTSGRVNSQIFADFYANGHLKRQLDSELDELQQPQAGAEPIKFTTRFSASMGTQRKALIKRAYAQYWRSPNYNFARIGIVVIQALIFGSSFVNFQYETVSDMASIYGTIFMITNFVGIVYYQSAIPFTSTERAVYYREQSARMYHVAPYAMGHALAELPYIIFNTLLCVTIFYFMASLEPDAAKFFWFYLFFALNTASMVFLGHAMTALLPTVKSAQAFGAVVNSILSMFAGFLLSPALVPSYWLWAYYLCPTHYTVEGMITSQFHDNDTPITAIDGFTQTTVAQYTYEFFGGVYSWSNRGYDVMALLLFIVAWRLLFFYAAAYVRHEKR